MNEWECSIVGGDAAFVIVRAALFAACFYELGLAIFGAACRRSNAKQYRKQVGRGQQLGVRNLRSHFQVIFLVSIILKTAASPLEICGF